MNLIHCYSTSSKMISIEAMLYSYEDDHSFYPWKPDICIVERRSNHWDVYYSKSSIRESQKLSKDIFEDHFSFDNTQVLLLEQISRMKKLADVFIVSDGLTSEMCKKYICTYKEFLHHYSFTNEFSFAEVEKMFYHELGQNDHLQPLLRGNSFMESDSYQAFTQLEKLKCEYQATGQIAENEIAAYVKRYAYLFNHHVSLAATQAYVRDLVYYAPVISEAEQGSAVDEVLEEGTHLHGRGYDHKIMRLTRFREIRLLMREAMMRCNYHLTRLLDTMLERRYSDYLSAAERTALINNLTQDDLFRLDSLDMDRLMQTTVNTLFYVNGQVSRLDRRNNLDMDSSKTVVDPVGTLQGQVVYGSGIVKGEVRTSYQNPKEGEKSYIYITKSLHPRDLLIRRNVKAFIVDEGGVLSHASIIAKEMCIPCILNTRLASLSFADGDYVSLDLDTGVVSLTEKQKTMTEQTWLHPLGKHIQNVQLFGNKCVNLCKYMDDYLVADGYVLDAVNVEEVYRRIKKGEGLCFSEEDSRRMKGLFPVIVRSSSRYEDTSRSTCAGLLESVPAVSSLEQLESAILEVCQSSQTKAMEVYSKIYDFEYGIYPSILIQAYYSFTIYGSILVRKHELVLDYQTTYSDERYDGTFSMDEVIEIESGLESNASVQMIISQAFRLIQTTQNHLIEFGIKDQKFYLLQIREFGG